MNNKRQEARGKGQGTGYKKSGFWRLVFCFLKNDKGFSLLEALVAITILGITLGTIMALFAGAMRSVAASEEHSKALILAKKGMEDAILMEDMHSGVEEGSFGNSYTWERTISPVEKNEKDEYSNEDIPFNLYMVEVKVKWWSGKTEKVIGLKSKVLKESIEE